MVITTRSIEETLALGRILGQAAAALAAEPPPLCIALDGQLGAGKTQLTRGIAVGAGVEDPSLVSSPTYVLLNIYPAAAAPGSQTVYHLDAYRTQSTEDFREGGVGFEELLAGEEGPGIVVVEWAARIAPLLPEDRLEIRLEHAPGDEADGAGNARVLSFDATGPRGRSLLQLVQTHIFRG